MNPDQLTVKMKDALNLSATVTRLHGHQEMTTLHLLLGIQWYILNDSDW